jgi:hypothetical protein
LDRNISKAKIVRESHFIFAFPLSNGNGINDDEHGPCKDGADGKSPIQASGARDRPQTAGRQAEWPPAGAASLPAEDRAILSEQSQMGISKNRCNWLMEKKLRIKTPVVKKNHFEKQSQF